jgi:hypothetical protein
MVFFFQAVVLIVTQKAIFEKYIKSFKQIFNYAIQECDKGHHFPLWATCLGFEFICMMPYDMETVIHNYKKQFSFKTYSG